MTVWRIAERIYMFFLVMTKFSPYGSLASSFIKKYVSHTQLAYYFPIFPHFRPKKRHSIFTGTYFLYVKLCEINLLPHIGVETPSTEN